MLVAILTLAIGAIAIFPTGRSSGEELVDAKPCSKLEAKDGFRQFIRAYNSGDFEKLDRLFTNESQFLAYTIGPPGLRAGARQRDTLVGYFKARHRKHDRLHFRSFSPHTGHGFPFFERSTHFSLQVARRANDFIGGRWFRVTGGKGAMICEEGEPKFFLLNIGGHPWMARR